MMNEDRLNLWKEKTKGLFNVFEWKSFWNYFTSLKQELEDYKSRRKKSIEYIKDKGLYEEELNIFNDDINYDELNELLNILNGD